MITYIRSWVNSRLICAYQALYMKPVLKSNIYKLDNLSKIQTTKIVNVSLYIKRKKRSTKIYEPDNEKFLVKLYLSISEHSCHKRVRFPQQKCSPFFQVEIPP